MKIPDYFKRELYMERIRPFIDTQMIKVIVGQRRIGKSYLLYQIMDEIRALHPDAEILYINKELFEFDSLKNYVDLVQYVRQNRKKNDRKCYLFIDEIQDILQYEKALRTFFAENDFDIYCTGSNANLLSGELASTLSGRYIEIKVHGLSYREFLQFHRLNDSDETFTKYYRFGGLPYLVNLPLTETAVSEYLLNIYRTILLKDIVSRYNIRNVRQLEDLVTYLADTAGHLFSANGISKYLKSQRVDILPKTILEYLNFLTNAFLVQRVKPIDLQGKNILRIGEKYYFEDLGIRHAIRPFRINDIGQVLENLVFQHLQIGGYSVAIGRNDDKEIDFVAEKAGERLYIQVATTVVEQQTAEREFGNLLKIKDNYPKMVITLDNIEGASYQGIRQIPVRKFLKLHL
ncbi:MAG: ATP-binding protein [Candidatus Symbiothrix sp.]|jgi:predicted AAA+ superfamily ATPase|nr:ATP-binding protein [Candidatus Symbiothrix sp.]